MRQRFLMIMVVALATGILTMAGVASAQQKVPPPLEKRTFGAPPTLPMQNKENLTPEQLELRKNSAGSEQGSWSDFLKEWGTPRAVPKSTVVMVDEKFGYPHIAVSFKMEVVPTPEGEIDDPDVVWMRGIPPDDPTSPLHKMWEERQAHEIYYKMQKAWEDKYGEEEYFLDFGSENVPAPFVDTLVLESFVKGLPASGRWQMNFSIADINEDGNMDLVFPPTRKGAPQPMIFLGKGDGGFTLWNAPRWSAKVPTDYGGVATGDIDGDGHQDVVLAIHFKGQYVFYGDGEGDFTRSSLLPSPDPRITSRAPTIADFDGDGRLDIALLAEIDYDLATNIRIDRTTSVWIVYNREKGWELSKGTLIAGVIGDNLEAADVNHDGRPDLILASNSTNFRKILLTNDGDGAFIPSPYLGVLSNALHSDIAVAPDGTEIYSVFVQFLHAGETNLGKTGIVRYPIGDSGFEERGTPVFVDDQRFDPFFRLGVGDLNADDRVDVVAVRKGGSIEVYLQMEGGQFYQETSEELGLERGTVFDVQLIDLNGDGRDDIIASFADKDERKGGVRVWLSRAKN